jgi:3-deoxy-D-manno-octulosonate 8-phosphate phosphatase (KDO 8-P phosphatase)
MIQTKNKLRSKCQKIKLVATDVDGVLTDGTMYYSEKGELLKKFLDKVIELN